MFSFQLIRIRRSPAFLLRRCDFTGSCFLLGLLFFIIRIIWAKDRFFFFCLFVSCAAKIKTQHQTSTLHPLGVFFSLVFKLTTVDWFCWNWQAAPCWDTCKILERKQCKLLKKPYHARLCFLHQRCVLRIWYLVEVSTFKKSLWAFWTCNILCNYAKFVWRYWFISVFFVVFLALWSLTTCVSEEWLINVEILNLFMNVVPRRGS